MFAWDQTESELFGSSLLMRTTTMKNLDEKSLAMRDKQICDTLFDNRALRKIGGFDPSSLLYHSISINRLCAKKESWEHFAKSSLGKKMLRHHFDDQTKVNVGQIRRGQRMRKSLSALYPIIPNKIQNPRSRASSFASVNSEYKNASVCTSLNYDIEDERSMQNHINKLTDSICITVCRADTTKSWGILLAREGAMCVVMRVPGQGNMGTGGSLVKENIRKGDLIVSIRNENNETINTSHHNDKAPSDWFSEAVGLFKRSCTLNLIVRRVSCFSGNR